MTLAADEAAQATVDALRAWLGLGPLYGADPRGSTPILPQSYGTLGPPKWLLRPTRDTERADIVGSHHRGNAARPRVNNRPQRTTNTEEW